MVIDNCSEGGEGLVIKLTEKIQGIERDILPLDTERCTNTRCKLNSTCKRYIQRQIDKQYVGRMANISLFNYDNGDCSHFIKNF